MSEESQSATVTAIAVALVAMSKSIAFSNPEYGWRLGQSLKGAEEAGIQSDDLKFLRMLVTSAKATAEARRNRPA